MYPEIHITETLSIETYLVYLSLLYCFLIFFVFKRADLRKKSSKIAMDLALILMVVGFIGGRLLHVFFEAPYYYKEDPWRVLYFWQGGFVYYGGFLSALAACLLYIQYLKRVKKYKSLSALSWADFYAPVIALGYGLGRISCFLAGCCYGGACDLPWAVVFPWDAQAIARHPVQLYMSAWELVVFLVLMLLEKRKMRTGKLFFIWLLLHGLGRLVNEQFRDDFRGDYIASVSLSSWISMGLILVAIFSLVILKAKAEKKQPTRPRKA